MKRLLRLLLLYLVACFARPFIRRPPASVTSVLYIKPDHLGDLLLATPVLAALGERVPQARITVLVGPWSQAVLERNPHVDMLLTCPFPGFTRQAGGAVWQPYLTLLRHALLLRSGNYDTAIIGRDDHWWGAALALLAGIPRRIGFAVPECRPFLTHALEWNPKDHVTAQGLALVACVEPGAAGQGPGHNAPRVAWPGARLPVRFDLEAADRAWADGWLRAHGITDSGQLVIIHPGTAGATKHWSAARWAEVGTALSASPHVRLLLTGGPGEQALVHQIADSMPAQPLTLAGQTTIGQLAALLQRAALVLGVDSGPLHLAAAAGTPTIHLYGPGDADRFGPWGDPQQHMVIRSGVWCSPCGVFSACPRGLAIPECMERIDVAPVLAAARRLLGM